jgi:uncharacterized membrane protein
VGGPYDGASSAAPFSVSDAIGYGWNAYWKNVGPMLVLTLVIVGVQLLVGVVAANAASTGIQVLARIVGWLIGLLLALGLIRASLAVTRGEKPEVGMLFQPEGFGSYIVASILFTIGMVIGIVLCIVPGIIFGLVFMFYGYVIAEQGDAISPTDALKRAAEISRGHRWELFGLGILLFFINVVGALLCGIGLLFSYGITAIAIAYAYRTLSGQNVVQPR